MTTSHEQRPDHVDGARLDSARRVLKDAASLCSVCATHWIDENYLGQNSGEIVYAVDVDVILMYMSPERKAEAAQVFSEATDVDLEVASLIGHYVVMALTQGSTKGPKHPLLLLPSHAAELRRIGFAISEKANLAADFDQQQRLEDFRKQKRHLEAELENLDETSAAERFLSHIATEVPALYDIVVGTTGVGAELQRLRRLPQDWLRPLSHHPLFAGSANAKPEISWLNEHTDKWLNRMEVDFSRITPFKLNLVKDDARALAVLEWLNSEFSTDNEHRRFVLITSTQRLLDAGRKADANSFHAGFASFSDAYLRDARSLLGAKDFFAGQGSKWIDTEFRVQEWMSVLFPNAVLQTRVDVDEVGKPDRHIHVEFSPSVLQDTLDDGAVEGALASLMHGYRGDPNWSFPESALSEWRDVVHGTHALRVLQDNKGPAAELLKSLKGPKDGQSRVDRFLSALTSQVQQSFASLYRSTRIIGVEQVLDQVLEQEGGIRGLPALRFDLAPYQEARKYYHYIVHRLFSSAQAEPIDLTPMYDDMAREDGSDYRAGVLHAFVYASAGLWFPTRVLCRNALLVCSPFGKDEQQPRGREAAFLLAVAERRLAVDDVGYKNARAALALARARCENEEETKDPRFASEELAQNVNKLQQRFFRTGELPGDFDPASTMEAAISIAATVIGNADEEPSVRKWVVRQAVTNGLLVGLVAAASGLKHIQLAGLSTELRRMLAEQQMAPVLDSDGSHAQLYPDETSDYVWLMATAYFDDSATIANLAKSRLAAFPARVEPRQFERLRSDKFAELVGLAVGSKDPL